MQETHRLGGIIEESHRRLEMAAHDAGVLRMDMVAKRYFWVFQLGTVLAVALLGAMTVNNVISGALSPLLVTAPPSQAKVDPGAKTSKTNTLSKLDDTSWRPPPKPPETSDSSKEEPEEQEPTEEVIPLGEGEYPLSDLNVKLNGTLVAANPRWSMAMLYDNGSRASFFVSTGESFLEVEVRKIERDRIVIEREGRLEQIDMENDGTKKPTSRSLSRPSRTPFGGKSPPAKAPAKPEPKEVSKVNDKFSKLREGITKKGDSSFTIDRKVIKEVLSNPSKYRDGTKPVPNYVGGKPNGF
ncbi:MAG: type II secretion system protein N, partial [Myxococcota bacterium]